jgi:hypothetical protein
MLTKRRRRGRGDVEIRFFNYAERKEGPKHQPSSRIDSLLSSFFILLLTS